MSDAFMDTKPLTCSVVTCIKDVSAKGLCFGHYQRLRNWNDVRAEIPLDYRRKLSMKKAQEIRALYKAKVFSQNMLAKKYGVHRRSIREILQHKNYKVVGE